MLSLVCRKCLIIQTAKFSTSSPITPALKDHYHLVVIGGGSGGLSIAAKFAEALKVQPKVEKGIVAVIEPSDTHYYQPMWTLVGAGIKKLEDSARPMAKVMPKPVKWIKDRVTEIIPEQNKVRLDGAGGLITYEYLVVACGINIDWQRINGLPEAFDTPGVCSNYSVQTVTKTFPAIQNFREGNAIFTFPNTPIKCAGAPQKIMYLTDAYLRQKGLRDKANLIYNTALGVVFAVPHYAKALTKICKERNLTVNTNLNLVEVIPDKKEAIFEDLQTNEKKRMKYELLHISPPMSAPKICEPIADPQTGYVSVNKETLQHTKYPNIFAIGDCSNLPTSKTAAAVAAQNAVLSRNLLAVMNGKPAYALYDGYTSCPLVTGFDKCILAEFDYNLEPLETFPVDQSKERRTMYYLKKEMMPRMYWNGLIKGVWNGPTFYRRIFHFGFAK